MVSMATAYMAGHHFVMHSGNQPRGIYSNNQPRTHVVHQVVVRGLVQGHLPASRKR